MIAAMHAARRLGAKVPEAVNTPLNLAMVDWFNKKGRRFAPSIMGSSVFAGLMERERMLEVRDLQGSPYQKALDGIGYSSRCRGPRRGGLRGDPH